VLILLVYYGITILLQQLLSLATGGEVLVDIDPFTAGTLTLGVIYGAFTTEVFRGAFLALDRGQIEAGRACGMSRTLVFRRIMLPQVWRFAIPGLGNIWLLLIKATALMSIVQLPELMRMTDVAARAVRMPFTFYFGASIIYLLITIVSLQLFQRAEAWANRGIRQA
jgi:ABC-type arginine transport system permease subunit